MSERNQIRRQVLRDGDVSVAILNLGCVTQEWLVPLDGAQVSVVQGYANPGDYADNPNYLGAIAGRVANRISGAGFEIDGQYHHLPANEPPNHLHGGPGGLSARLWDMSPDGARVVRLRLLSENGDQGYPGAVTFEVTITLAGYEVLYDMRATADRPTPVNLAQHSYYNLMGHGDVLDHHLQISADEFTPTDGAMIPTGQIGALAGKNFDMSNGKTLQQADPEGDGLDINFVLSNKTAQPAARLSAPNGMRLTLTTDQPCLQLYTGANMRALHPPLPGQTHAAFCGVCLEPQGFPNAVNTPGFRPVMITPDHPYHQRTRIKIAPQDVT